jgi:hypothetical protein
MVFPSAVQVLFSSFCFPFPLPTIPIFLHGAAAEIMGGGLGLKYRPFRRADILKQSLKIILKLFVLLKKF